MTELISHTTMNFFRQEMLHFLLTEEPNLDDGEETPQIFFEEVIREVLSARTPDPLTEVWRPIPEFPHYSINRCGEILNSRGWIMKVALHRRKDRHQNVWENVVLSYNNQTYGRSIGALLKSAFADDYKEN